MKRNFNILVDTSFWIALLDNRDQHHRYAIEREEWINEENLIVPWPVLYETVRTRLARKRDRLALLDQYLKRPQVIFLDDVEFRDQAYTLAVEYSVQYHRPFSMVDMLCRLLIEDDNTKIQAILTTNDKDFQDICRKTGTTIL